MILGSGVIEFLLDEVENGDPTIPPKLVFYSLATEEMVEYWNDKLCAIYADILELADTMAEEGPRPLFSSSHFVWYYRYSLSVSNFV
jgi:hypothetical protein